MEHVLICSNCCNRNTTVEVLREICAFSVLKENSDGKKAWAVSCKKTCSLIRRFDSAFLKICSILLVIFLELLHPFYSFSTTTKGALGLYHGENCSATLGRYFNESSAHNISLNACKGINCYHQYSVRNPRTDSLFYEDSLNIPNSGTLSIGRFSSRSIYSLPLPSFFSRYAFLHHNLSYPILKGTLNQGLLNTNSGYLLSRCVSLTTTFNPSYHSRSVASSANLGKRNSLITSEVSTQLNELSNFLPQSFAESFKEFIKIYALEVADAGTLGKNEFSKIILDIITALRKSSNFHFSPFHKAIRSPIDYYKIGNEVWRPLIDFEHSKLPDIKVVQKIKDCLQKGENVVLLSNHQTEPDPQVMRLIFERIGLPDLGEKLVMIAGHRVRTDPLSIPFSMGCNLLCVYSKKHLDYPVELRDTKMRENIQTMNCLQNLLCDGGNLIWVAPSGGRDRPSPMGEFDGKEILDNENVVVADFDAKTIQLYRIMAKKSSHCTHFFPMALYSAPICPPPKVVRKDLGESRTCAFSPVGMAISDKMDNSIISHTEFSKAAENTTKNLYKDIHRFISPYLRSKEVN